MLAQKRLQKDLENLQNDLKVLINDAKEVGVERLSETEAVLTETSSEQFKQMAKRAQETISSLRSQLRESSQKVEQVVENHPFAAIGTALGVGFVLGKLGTMRKSSSP